MYFWLKLNVDCYFDLRLSTQMGERRNHLALSCQVFNRILLCVHYVSWVNVRIKRTCSFLLWCHSFAFCLYLPLGPGISCLFFLSFLYFVPSSCLPWLRYAPHLYALAGIQFILISAFNIKNFQFNLMTLYSLFYHVACPKSRNATVDCTRLLYT